MGDVGQRIIQLLVRQRPAAPVGEARRLVDMDVFDAADQLVIGDAVAEAADHGGDLRVEDRMRNEIAAIEDDFDVLAGRMKDLQHLRIGHQLEEGGEIDALGQRIDENFRRRACHLDQAELRPEGRFAQEFGVDGNEVGLGQLFAGGRQIGGGFDHIISFARKRSVKPSFSFRFDMSIQQHTLRALLAKNHVQTEARREAQPNRIEGALPQLTLR